jgi:hypothetical protein
MADEAAPVYLDVLDARAVVAEAYRGLCMPAGRDHKGDHGPAGRAVTGRYPERAALAVVEVFAELHMHVVAAPAHRAAQGEPADGDQNENYESAHNST